MKDNYKRILDISIPKGQSAWLWGPRKTGKTTFLKDEFAKSAHFDLLDTDLFMALERRPALFREQVQALPQAQRDRPIIVDEVQKVPPLLDEVHRLIETSGLQFLLCGSSARKLRRGHANMLGGRAWRFEMFPLVFHEVGEFDLLTALQRGLIPSHYLSPDPQRSLQAYTADYLNEEIRAEGLSRNLPAFSHFLEAASFSACEPVNYSNIARDVGIDAKTVKEYFFILVDTFTGYLVEPYRKVRRRQIISAAPKFYFFDVGLGNYLAKRTINHLTGSDAGKAFENYIMMELTAYLSYKNLQLPIKYWRTKTGLEVDYIVGQENPIGIEVKLQQRVDRKDLKGLLAFSEEADVSKLIVVSLENQRRQVREGDCKIDVLPWRDFLEDLWSDRFAGDLS